MTLLERLRKECKLTAYPAAQRYLVTNRFTTGDLKGLMIVEETSVRFEVGFECDYHPWCGPGYEVMRVVEIPSATLIEPQELRD